MRQKPGKMSGRIGIGTARVKSIIKKLRKQYGPMLKRPSMRPSEFQVAAVKLAEELHV